MSKLIKTKPASWFLCGWLAVFAVLFPQGVVVCIGEPAHVELGILGSACCDEDSHLTTVPAGVSTHSPTNMCADCTHVQATSWHYRSVRKLGKGFGRNANTRGRPVGTPAATFGNLEKNGTSVRFSVADPIPPLLLKHLSTSVLIC
jgi:hypothetical protein